MLEKEFSLLLDNHIKLIKKEVYTPTAFIRMIGNYGKLGAVKKLLETTDIQEGFETLLAAKSTDLTIEAFVLSSPAYYSLFTLKMLSNAQYKLEKLDPKLLAELKVEFGFDFNP